MNIQSFSLGLSALLLAACSTGEAPRENAAGATESGTVKATAQLSHRWYTFQQIDTGSGIFQQNCSVCHGSQAEGAGNWRESGPDGKYPAPPLDGSGHAWHHPLKILFQVIKHGSPGGQGNMPAWSEKLSEEDMISVIAWFQSKWPEEIYLAWMQRELASRKGDG